MSGNIEWLPHTLDTNAPMSMEVLDFVGVAPSSVIDIDDPFKVKVKWEVPAGVAPILGGDFRIRVFAESMGPGPEKQLGTETIVPVVPGQEKNEIDIDILDHQLEGEGTLPSGENCSGVYKLVTALQHRNPAATEVGGYAEADGLIQIRRP